MRGKIDTCSLNYRMPLIVMTRGRVFTARLTLHKKKLLLQTRQHTVSGPRSEGLQRLLVLSACCLFDINTVTSPPWPRPLPSAWKVSPVYQTKPWLYSCHSVRLYALWLSIISLHREHTPAMTGDCPNIGMSSTTPAPGQASPHAINALVSCPC